MTTPTERDLVNRREWWTPYAYVGRRLHSLWGDLSRAADLPADAVIVDYGCGNQPYRSYFPPRASYLGVDLPGNPAATVELAPDGAVPLADGTADAVVSSQVLEHVTDPSLYLRESYRLLRPGGSLLLSTHGLMYLHLDPTDFWRWTGDGLAKIVEEAGFEVVELRGLLSLAATGVHFVQDGLRERVPRLLRPAFYLVCQGTIALLDRFHSDEGRRHNAMVFAIHARKA